MAELDDILKEFSGGDEVDALINEFLPDTAVLDEGKGASEDEPGQNVNLEESKSSNLPTSEYKTESPWYRPKIDPRTEAPEVISGEQWKELRKKQKAGEVIDFSKYSLEGGEGMSEKEMDDHAQALIETSTRYKKMGDDLYMNQREKGMLYSVADEAKAQSDLEVDDASWLGKLRGATRQAGQVLGAALQGKAELVYDPEGGKVGIRPDSEYMGKLVEEAKINLEEGYHLDKAKEKTGGGFGLRDYLVRQYVAEGQQKQFLEDSLAGLVNQYNQPIKTEEEWNADPDKDRFIKDYAQYRRTMYLDRQHLSPQEVTDISGNPEKWAAELDKTLAAEGSLEEGRRKVWDAFEAAGIDPLTPDEISAVKNDKGFMSELKLVGEMLIQEPDDTLKSFGFAILEDMPELIFGSRGLGILGKIGSRIRTLAKSKKLRFMNRYGGKYGTAAEEEAFRAAVKAKPGLTFKEYVKTKEGIDATKLAITKPTLSKVMGKHMADDLFFEAILGYTHEQAVGSEYNGAKFVRNMAMGAVFNGVASGISMAKASPKPTKRTVAEAEKIVSITPGMEKHKDVNRMMKMFAALSRVRALEGMGVHIDPFDAGLHYRTKQWLKENDYGEMKEGWYFDAGVTKDGKVNLKAMAGPETVIEETAHFVYDHVRAMAKKEADNIKVDAAGTAISGGDGPYSQLWDMISIWERQVKNRAAQLGVKIPLKGELFAATLTSKMGWANHYKMHRPVINRIEMPDELTSMLRQVWSDDPVLKGNTYGKKRDIGTELDPDAPARPDAEPEVPPKPERGVDEIRAELKDVTEMLGGLDDGPEKNALGKRYQGLVKEEMSHVEQPGHSVIPTARKALDKFERRPDTEGLDDFINDLDVEIKDPENAGRVKSLKKFRNKAKALQRKRDKELEAEPAYQLKKAATDEEMKAFAEKDKINIKIRGLEGMTEKQKLAQVDKLSAENEKIIKPLIKQIDKKLGTKSKEGRKKHEVILEKIERPDLLARKPFMQIEHVSDTYRFQTELTKTTDVMEAINMAMKATGAEVAALDNRMFNPTYLGYRAVNLDLMMPNGQLVEFQLPIKEIADVKDKGHLIYEKWRDTSEAERVARRVEYMADLDASNKMFQDAFDAYLSRVGETADEAAASLSKLSDFEPSTRLKLASKSATEGAPSRQEPSSRISEKSSETAQTRPVSESSATLGSDIVSPPTSIIAKSGDNVNFQVKKAEFVDVEGTQFPAKKRGGELGLVGITPRYKDLSLSGQKAAVKKLINQYHQYAKEGAVGKEWYKESSDTVLEMAHYDPDDARKLAKLLALTSPQSAVKPNFDSAIRLWYEYKDQANRGIHPNDMKFTQAFMETQNKRAFQAIIRGEEVTGQKVNNFYRNLMSEVDNSIEQGVTIDSHMGYAAGFISDKYTPGQYEFMVRATRAVAKRMDVSPLEAQAMIWTGWKRRWDYVKKEAMEIGMREGWAMREGKKIVLPKKLNSNGNRVTDPLSKKKQIETMHSLASDLKGDMNAEAYSYADVFEERSAGRLAYETVPGPNSGLLEGIDALKYEDKLKLMVKIDKAMDDGTGKNIIFKEVGLIEKGFETGHGWWDGISNPNDVYKLAMPLKKGAREGTAQLTPETERMLDLSSALFGYFLKQDGVGWHMPTKATTLKTANLLSHDIKRWMTPDELRSVETALSKEFGNKNAALMLPSENGGRFINMTNEPWYKEGAVSNPEFHKRVKGVLEKSLDADGGIAYYNTKTKLIENKWKDVPDGQDFIRKIGELGGLETLRRLNDVLSPKLRKIFGEYADEYGLTSKGDWPPSKSNWSEGPVEPTSYQLKRHSETPPPKHSGRGGQSFDLTSEKAWDSFRRVFQDRFRPVKRVQQAIEEAGGEVGLDANTYLSEVVYYGRGQARVENAGKKFIDPITDYMKAKKLSLQEVDDYLYARHAPERNKTLLEKGVKDGSGMSNSDAAQIMSGFRNENKVKELEAIAKMVDRMHKRIIDIKLEGGLIGEDYVNMLPGWKHYVPLRGFEDPHHPLHAQGIQPGTRSNGFSTNAKERKALGRSSRADSRLSNSVAMMNDAIISSEKNKVGQSFLQMVLDNPDGTFVRPDGARMKLWEVDPVQMQKYMDPNGQIAYRKKTHQNLGPNEFSVSVDGNQHIITIADPHLANAMKQVGVNSGNMFLRGLQTYNRFMAMINTSMNPEFVLSNFSRDLQTAGFHLTSEQSARMTAQVMKDVFPAMAGAIAGANGKTSGEWSNWYQRFQNAGGKMGWFGLKNIDDVSGELQKKIRRTGKWGRTLESAKTISGLLGSVNEGVENSFRLATFKNMVENGVPEPQAAMVAKELTVNFNRKGEVGSVVNGLYLFFNASLQGISRMVQATTTNPKMQAMGAALTTQGYLASMYNYSMAGDDDAGYNNWDRVPPWVKERNMVFMDPSGDGQYTSLPMPYGYSIFWNMGGAMAELQKGIRSKTEVGKDLFMSSISAFNPLGTQNSKTAFGAVMKSVTPTVGQPGIQHILNENFAGRPIKPSQAPWGAQKPESQTYFPSSRLASRKVAERLNSASGGTIHRPGWLDVSPEVMDHYWDTMTGGIGKFTGNSFNMMYGMYAGEKPDVSKVPFLRRLRGQTNDYWTTNRYREIGNELTQLKRDERLVREEGTDIEKEKLKMHLRHKTTNTQLKQIRQMQDRIKEADGDPEKIEKLNKQMTKLRNGFLRAYRNKIEKKEAQ